MEKDAWRGPIQDIDKRILMAPSLAVHAAYSLVILP